MFLEAPLSVVWNLVGDPERHPQWWPRVLEVSGQSFDEGSNYAQVVRNPLGGRLASRMHIDRLDDLREIQMSCNRTGTIAHWLLTEAEGGTFVEIELGMNPKNAGGRVFDAVLGRMYFQRWIETSLEGLRSASEAAAAQKPRPPGQPLQD
ncbi:hypothetical protein BH10ACT11_BH10ACT11_00610 [soil metagenome]